MQTSVEYVQTFSLLPASCRKLTVFTIRLILWFIRQIYDWSKRFLWFKQKILSISQSDFVQKGWSFLIVSISSGEREIRWSFRNSRYSCDSSMWLSGYGNKRLQICSDEHSSFRFKGVWEFFFSRNRILWFQSSSKDSLTRERVCDVRSVSDTHFTEHSSLEKWTVDMIHDKDLKSWPFRYVTEKKFNVCMCVCPVYMCVCPPLSMWITLSFRDFAPYLLIGWLCRIAIADFAPYLLLSSHILLLIVKSDTSIPLLSFFVLIGINQTRASFFYHKLRFADKSILLLLKVQKSRHEHSCIKIIWDLNCWQDWFLRFLTFIGERTVAIAGFVIVLISLLILRFCRHEHSYLLIFLLIRDLQTRASFFFLSERFELFYVLLFLLKMICRHEHSSIVVQWRMNCWQDWFCESSFGFWYFCRRESSDCPETEKR